MRGEGALQRSGKSSALITRFSAGVEKSRGYSLLHKQWPVILSCHHERPSAREESAFSSQLLLQYHQKQIPRFARNDNFRKAAVNSKRPTGILFVRHP
jgi:hypothetical protein